mmetsp:Transcript_25158/g.78949  ORF Transcript_25158/g.78949 Transcript_25158/m.78949 type:complete len:235 (-) Transcript_25158:372-1076(-)
MLKLRHRLRFPDVRVEQSRGAEHVSGCAQVEQRTYGDRTVGNALHFQLSPRRLLRDAEQEVPIHPEGHDQGHEHHGKQHRNGAAEGEGVQRDEEHESVPLGDLKLLADQEVVKVCLHGHLRVPFLDRSCGILELALAYPHLDQARGVLRQHHYDERQHHRRADLGVPVVVEVLEVSVLKGSAFKPDVHHHGNERGIHELGDEEQSHQRGRLAIVAGAPLKLGKPAENVLENLIR